MKKLFLICAILITILSISAVSAEDNTTDTIEIADDTTEISLDEPADSQKTDLNVEIYYPTHIVKPEPDAEYPTVEFNKLPLDYDGQISIYIDDKFTAKRSYEYYDDIINLRSYSYGIHNISVIIPETSKYNGLNHTGSFEVTKGYIKIDSEINSNEGVTLVLLEGATGYLTVNVDGKLFKKVKVKAEEECLSHSYVSLGDLSLGVHTVEAIYSGDAKNKKITKKATVNVTHDIPIEIEKQLIYIHNGLATNAYKSEQNYITIYLPSDASKKPIVEIDGATFDVDSSHKVDTRLLKSGNHTIKVTYPGDDKYSPKTVEKSFQTVYSIRMIDYYAQYNNSKISLDLPEDAQGNLSVYVDGEIFESIPMGNDTATIYLNGIRLGKHNITAAYEGRDYEVKNQSQEVMFIPNAIYPSTMTYGDNETMYIEINPDANLTVTARKDGKTFNLTFIDGKADIPLSDLMICKFGEEDYDWNHIELKCKGDIEYSLWYDIYVSPIPARLVGAKDITMYCGDSKTYQLTVWGDYGKKIGKGDTVTVKIGSKYYYPKTNANGVINLKINEAPGTYNIISTYHGKTVKSKLTVKHVVSLKTVKVKRSAKTLTLQATLKNTKAIKNKQVTFKFAGKTYKAKTNAKGIAKVTVPKSVLGKLKAGKTVTYQATYLKDTVKKTAKVKK